MELTQLSRQYLYEEFIKLHMEVDVMEKMIQAKRKRMDEIIPLIDLKLITTHISSRFEIMEVS